MNNISRRKFLGTSLALGGAALATQLPFSLSAMPAGKMHKLPLGFQVWTIREELLKDFPGTLRKMAAMGYETVEMCSPPGYGWTPLMKYSGREMLTIVNDAGLKLESTHYGMAELRKNLDERIGFAAESGQKQMILSSFGLPGSATMDDWIKAADELNEIGRKTKAAGIQAGFHNHHGEFEEIGGVLIYDELLKRFDPDLVKMQFQVAVVNIGFLAADYFTKFPGRFISAHLADWSILDKKSVPLGKGIVDWKGLFAAAGTGGVKNIFVEMDPVTFAESVRFYNQG
jgi:sugar phosphate isomerase/epimerase